MLDNFIWWFQGFQYWAREHVATVLFFVVVSLFLYATIVGLNLLRRIADTLERTQK